MDMDVVCALRVASNSWSTDYNMAEHDVFIVDSDDLEEKAQGICRELCKPGFFLIRLQAAAAAEIHEMQSQARIFFSQSEDVKRMVGSGSDSSGVGGEGIGYRNQPEHESEFLETFLSLRTGGTHPSVAEPDGLARAAAAVHRHLTGVSRRLLAILAAFLRLPPAALFDAAALWDADADVNKGIDDGNALSSSLLRICHYRAAAGAANGSTTSTEAGGVGMEMGSATADCSGSQDVLSPADVVFPEHADSTLLTLSPLFAHSPGLQLKLAGGAFLEAERLSCVQEGAATFVEVHAGDYLGVLSRGVFGALRHRVVRQHSERLSCPLLLRPRHEWRQRRGWLEALADANDDTSSEEDEAAEPVS